MPYTLLQSSHSHSGSFDLELARCLSDPNASSSTITLDSDSQDSVISPNDIKTARRADKGQQQQQQRDGKDGVEQNIHCNPTFASKREGKDALTSINMGRVNSGMIAKRRGEKSEQQSLQNSYSCSIQNQNRDGRNHLPPSLPESFKSSSNTFSNLFSWLSVLILLASLPTTSAIFDPGEPKDIKDPSSSSSSSSTISSISNSLPTSTSIWTTVAILPTPSRPYEPKYRLEEDPTNQLLLSNQDDFSPTDSNYDLIPFSNSDSLYSSRQVSLPPGCKRVKDLFINTKNGFCLNPMGDFNSNHQDKDRDGEAKEEGIIESELVICEMDEVEPLLKSDQEGDSSNGDQRTKKKTKMRSYAISGKITSPFPLEIEPDLKSLEKFLDFQKLESSNDDAIIRRIESTLSNNDQVSSGTSSSPTATTSIADANDSIEKSKVQQEEEDEKDWPKEGIETQNGYWRQVNGKMKWQPRVSEPEPLIIPNENHDHQIQKELPIQSTTNSVKESRATNSSRPTQTHTTSSVNDQFPTKTLDSSSSATTNPTSAILQDSDSISSSQSRAYSSWTSVQSSVAAAAAAASKASGSKLDEIGNIKDEPEPTPSFLSFSEWKEIHLKQEREELGRIKESKRRDGSNESNSKDSLRKSQDSNQNSTIAPSVSTSMDQDSIPRTAIEPHQTQISSKDEEILSNPIVTASTTSTDPISDPIPPSEEMPITGINSSSDLASDSNLSGGALPALGDPIKQLSNLKHRWNFASFDCAAVVHRSNPSAKFASAILSEKKDRYMLSPCPSQDEGDEGQFVIVELCDEISIDTIVLGNYEFFSRMFKRFRVRVARNLQGKEDEWYDVGTFRARNVRGLQVSTLVC